MLFIKIYLRCLHANKCRYCHIFHQQIEVHNLEMEQQRLSQQASLAEVESALRKAHEQRKEECTLLKERHKSEMEKVLAEKALALADSDSSRLKREVESQKVGMFLILKCVTYFLHPFTVSLISPHVF